MIQQIIENKTVQTNLAVKVDGIYIKYRRENCGINYEFCVGIGEKEGLAKNCQVAMEKVLKVVEAMEQQSKSKKDRMGVTYWKRNKIEEDVSALKTYGTFYVRVGFGIDFKEEDSDGIV